MEAPDARRVLIVDDDPDVAALRVMLVGAIRQAADVRVAGDGLAALSPACQWQPHIVLISDAMALALFDRIQIKPPLSSTT